MCLHGAACWNGITASVGFYNNTIFQTFPLQKKRVMSCWFCKFTLFHSQKKKINFPLTDGFNVSASTEATAQLKSSVNGIQESVLETGLKLNCVSSAQGHKHHQFCINVCITVNYTLNMLRCVPQIRAL